MPRWGVVSAALGGVGVAACLSASAFVCSQDSDCTGASGDGFCEASDHCSFNDDECESGRRYGPHAGDLAGTCVPGSMGTAGTTSTTGPGDGGSSDSDGGATAGPRCGDGVPDPGEACDDGNAVDGDGCNVDCVVSGTVLLSESIDFGMGLEEKAFGLAVDEASGRYGVAGFGTDADGLHRIWVRVYEADDTQAWEQVVQPEPASEALGIDFDGQGRVVVVGFTTQSAGQGGNEQVWIRQYSPVGGELWTSLLSSGIDAAERATDVATDANDDIVITGRVGVAAGHAIVVAKYAPDGAPRWTVEQFTSAGSFGTAPSLAVDDDGSIVVAGHILVAAGDSDIRVTRYSPDGVLQTDVGWAGPVGGVDRGTGVGLRSDGSVLVTALVEQTALSDGWIGRFEPDDPTPIWTSTLEGAADERDELQDVVAFADGSFVAVGWINDAGHDDTWVRRYDPGGEPMWTDVYSTEGQGRDRLFQVALAADGTVLAVGYETTPDQGINALVRRYAP